MTQAMCGSQTQAGAGLGEEALAQLRQAIRGRVAVAGSQDSEEARTVWNGMIDRHPAVAVRWAAAPFSTGSVYVNFLTQEEGTSP